MQEIAARFVNENIAVHKIIWLAGSVLDTNDDLKELCWDDPDKLIQLLEIEDPRAITTEDGTETTDEMDSESFLTATAQAGKLGFLIEVATPVRRPNGLFTWSYYHTEWMYVEQFDAKAVDAISAWAKRMAEKDVAEGGRDA